MNKKEMRTLMTTSKVGTKGVAGTPPKSSWWNISHTSKQPTLNMVRQTSVTEDSGSPCGSPCGSPSMMRKKFNFPTSPTQTTVPQTQSSILKPGLFKTMNQS